MARASQTQLVPTTEETALDTQTKAAAEALAKYAGAGTDEVDRKFVRPPALALAQDTSDEKKKNNEKYIPGLESGQFFNSLTGQIYPLPLAFVVIKSLGHRNMLYAKGKMGVVLERNLPDSDLRTQFRDIRNADGTITSTKPEAVQYHDFLVYLPAYGETLTLSFKSTTIKTAIKLNSQIVYPLRIGGKTIANPPAFARAFTLGVASDKNDLGEWFVPTVTPDGLVDPTCETFATLAALYESYNKVQIEVVDGEVSTDEAPEEKLPF